MSTKTFDEFVRRRLDEVQTNGSNQDVDWNRRREDWIRSLNDLYSKIEKYLKKYTEAAQIHLGREEIQLSEEHIGTYQVEALTVQIGNEKVVAKPIGTLLIGAAGRVDLIGARGMIRLVLLEGQPTFKVKAVIGGRVEEEVNQPVASCGNIDKSRWYIATLSPNAATTPLIADTFRDALIELSDV